MLFISPGGHNAASGEGKERERSVLLAAHRPGIGEAFYPSQIRVVGEGDVLDDGLNRLARGLVRHPALDRDTALQADIQFDGLARCGRGWSEAGPKIGLALRRDELDGVIGVAGRA